MGKGVFASKDIKAGTVIGDYIGKVIRTKDEEKYDNKGHFYLMYYHDRASIFPDVKTPGVHTINHSCTPNTWMYTFKGHTLYFAIRHIFKGEQITVSYLMSEQDKDCKPCDHICLCANYVCTGSMHMTKEKYDKWSKISEKEETKTKYAPIRYGKMLAKLDTYPNEIADHPFYSLFGNTKVKSKVLQVSKLPSVAEIRKTIRQTGRTLKFIKLNLHVLGVYDGVVVSTSII